MDLDQSSWEHKALTDKKGIITMFIVELALEVLIHVH